jgi:hypothetical protein
VDAATADGIPPLYTNGLATQLTAATYSPYDEPLQYTLSRRYHDGVVAASLRLRYRIDSLQEGALRLVQGRALIARARISGVVGRGWGSRGCVG